MPKMKSYASYADWRKDQTASNQRIIDALQRLIESVAPQLGTMVKWGQGCFADGDAPKIYLHTEKDYVQLGFYMGARFEDPDRLLEGSGKYVRHVKVRSVAEIRPEAFTALIEQALR
jgi:hypothetical protein